MIWGAISAVIMLLAPGDTWLLLHGYVAWPVLAVNAVIGSLDLLNYYKRRLQ